MNLDLLMVGLPNSGKTTFLAALWEVVIQHQASLALRHEPEDRQYFWEIGQRWVKLQEQGHSNIDAPKHAELPLASDTVEFDLRIPDVYGEAFNQAWEGTAWPAEVVRIAADADAVLLFVSGLAVVSPIEFGPAHPSREGQVAVDWAAEKAPTQTKLADLLGGIDDLNRCELPVAVVISAWDVPARVDGIDPAAWLQLKLPLLWQMLEAGRVRRPYRVWGISAQGGDVTDPEERARLERVDPPHERIRVIDGDSESHDIGLPINWLVDQVQ